MKTLKNFESFTNLERLTIEMSNKNYFSDTADCEPARECVYYDILVENGLDPMAKYDKANDQIPMLESVYTLLQMLSNNIDVFTRVETEFATTSAAYQYLQKRLKDVRAEIDRIKLETHYKDDEGNTSSIVGYMFCN